MPERKITPQYIADHIRRVLRDGGSAPHSQEVQVFFKEVVKSRGWYTAELRKVAVRMRRSVVREMGMEFLVQLRPAFLRRVLEEKVFAVFLLENETDLLGEKDFRLSRPGSTASAVGPITMRWCTVCWRPCSLRSPHAAARSSAGPSRAIAGSVAQLAWR